MAYAPVEIGTRANVRLAAVDGRPVAVTAGIETGVSVHRLQVWDLLARRPLGDLGSARSTALAVTELDGRPVVLTAGAGGLLQVRDLAGRGLLRELGGGAPVFWWAVAGWRPDGSPAALTLGHDRTLRVWDLDARQPIEEIALPGDPHGLALGEEGGVALAVDGDLVVLETNLTSTRRVPVSEPPRG